MIHHAAINASSPPAVTEAQPAATDHEMVDAYGMQREICARAELDSDGSPLKPPLDPVGATFRLTGPLSLSHLSRAVELVTDCADVLRGRLSFVNDRFMLAKEPGLPAIPFVTIDLRGRRPDDQQQRMAYFFHHCTGFLSSMQEGSPGVFAVAILGDEEHVVYTRFDHAMLDQQSIYSLLRRVGRTYARLIDEQDPAEDLSRWRSSEFFPFARDAQADVVARRTADEFWRPLVRDSVCELAMPGRSWRPWRERRSTENLSWVMPDVDARAMTEARRITGASQMFLYLAALSVVIAGATDTDFVPLTYHRHGGQGVEPILGPLWDTLITLPPSESNGGLARWVTEFAAVNTQVPSMRGLALVDFASLDKVMELRRFTVNVLLPNRPLFFGPLRAERYTVADGRRGPATGVKKVKNNVGIRLFVLGTGRFEATLHYDPDDFADRERIFTAACHVVRRVVEQPKMSLDQARFEALRVLRGDRP